VYAAYVTLAAPAKRASALGLLTVLTTSTFLFTNDVLNAPQGAYAWSHNMSGTAASVIGKKGSLIKNAVFVLFSGLIIVDVANVALVLTITDEDTEAAPAAAKEEPAAEKDIEAAAPAAEEPVAEVAAEAEAPASA
jgi:hypothetical protein